MSALSPTRTALQPWSVTQLCGRSKHPEGREPDSQPVCSVDTGPHLREGEGVWCGCTCEGVRAARVALCGPCVGGGAGVPAGRARSRPAQGRGSRGWRAGAGTWRRRRGRSAGPCNTRASSGLRAGGRVGGSLRAEGGAPRWCPPPRAPAPAPRTHFLHMATNLWTDTAPVRSPPAPQKSGPFQ